MLGFLKTFMPKPNAMKSTTWLRRDFVRKYNDICRRGHAVTIKRYGITKIPKYPDDVAILNDSVVFFMNRKEVQAYTEDCFRRCCPELNRDLDKLKEILN